MRDGTEQRQRLPEPWARGAFKVDEMSLDRLIEACAQVGDRLRFVDLNGHEQGTWGPWFDSDETLVLARIASIDRYGRQQAFLAKVGSAPFAELAHHVLELAQLLNGWLQALSGRASPVAAVHQLIEQLVERQLAGQLRWLAERVRPATWEGRSLAAMVEGLSPAWQAGREDPSLPEGDPRREHLRGMYFSFLTAVTQVRALAREVLPQTLMTGRHEPSTALLLAFLGLYETVQQQVNRFADLHVDFYYRRCLGLAPRAAQSDRAAVACRLDPLAPPELALPAGTAFVAGKDMAGQPLLFRTQEGAVLGDAQVAALCTLRLQRDPRIQPEATLRYVTGIRAHRLSPPLPDSAAVPTFGGGPDSQEATLGLAVATPALLLKEGSRRVELTLRLSWPRRTDEAALAPGLRVRGRPAAEVEFGVLFGSWLLGEAAPELTPHQRARLAALLALDELQRRPPRPVDADIDAPGEGGDEGAGEATPDALEAARQRAFFRHVRALFEVALTTEQGWFTPAPVQIARAPGGRTGSGGLQLTFQLRPEDPPIVACDPQVHGGQWPTRLPLLRLQVNPRACIHPYSLLAGARLLEAEVRVKVQGAKGILLQNNVGALDPAKTFSPFGPLPTSSSYLVFGSPEAARKNLEALDLDVEWGGLPQEPGGLAAHYEGYGEEQRAGRYTVALSILRDGQWQPCQGLGTAHPLFGDADSRGRLSARQRIVVDAESVRQHAWASEVPLDVIGPGTRNGLVRMQLNHPRGAFGHAAYPALLADALSARARRRRATALPNAPYTPTIEAIHLDYEAVARIRPDAEGRGAAADGERLLHIHPFGVAELRPDAQVAYHGVLPDLGQDGSLFIGLQASRLEGPLNLLFDLREDDAPALGPTLPPATLQWSCLQANLWRPLPPRCLLSDETRGMLSSGVVRLDLPALATNDNSVLEPGLFWLRVSRSQGPAAAAALRSVHAQAVMLEREMGAAGAADAPLPAGRISQPAVPVAGLAGVLQPYASRGWRPAEDEPQFRVRVGERLRHRNRGSLGWDIERLVLEEFPEVFKVKCLCAGELPSAATQTGSPDASLEPGADASRVVVVVVPRVRVSAPEDSLRAPRFDANRLRRIQEFLAARCSPFARLQVRNASYERVQVRCRLRLKRNEHAGSVLRRVNRALIEFLSPWHDGEGAEDGDDDGGEKGHGARFGWMVRGDELQAVVRKVPGVAEVGALSLLHLVETGEGHFVLHDTARVRSPAMHLRAGASGDTRGDARVTFRDPWSLALPMGEHLIGVARRVVGHVPRATGVSLLGVGETFVVGGSGP